jgi:hypothetical protein
MVGFVQRESGWCELYRFFWCLVGLSIKLHDISLDGLS